MGKINFGRVLLGGLVTGLVINSGEYLLNGVLLAKQMEDTFRKMNVTAPGGNFIAVAVALTFVLGIVIVWLYALIRPRLGPGPKTAIVAALIAWFSIYLYKGTLNGLLFAIPLNSLVIAFAWALVAYILGAIAGAWFYKEL